MTTLSLLKSVTLATLLLSIGGLVSPVIAEESAPQEITPAAQTTVESVAPTTEIAVETAANPAQDSPVLVEPSSTKSATGLPATKFIGSAKNYSVAAANHCKAARDENDANAQFALGWLYTNGRGVEKNEDLAAMFFKMAADQQHASAQSWLKNSKGNPSLASLPSCMLPDPPTHIASVHQEEKELATEKREVKAFYTKGPIHKIVSKIAPEFQIDTDLVMAFIAVESGFNPHATSPKNAQGLMQLIPETAARFNVKDAYNPEQNVKGGMSYIRWLLAHFKGDLELVAAAYNAGENAVIKYKGIPPYPETQAYVKKIISLYGARFHPYQASLGVKPAFIQASANEAWPKTKTTKP